MGNSPSSQTEKLFIVNARLSEIGKLLEWIEQLAVAHAIPAKVAFGMYVCVEEVVANTIQHGYRGDADCNVTVRFREPSAGHYTIVLEDSAPPFNPLLAPELPPLNPRDEIRIGGQGLRLLREFTKTLDHQSLPAGNRFTLTFSA